MSYLVDMSELARRRMEEDGMSARGSLSGVAGGCWGFGDGGDDQNCRADYECGDAAAMYCLCCWCRELMLWRVGSS